MDVSVLISWKTCYEQFAWSLGYCQYCQQLEAVRVENAIEIISVWFIPVHRQVSGKIGRCDFCERPIGTSISPREIPLPEWSPSNGLDTLVAKLALSDEIRIPENSSSTRIHSLLAAAQEASSINNLDISFGITTGIVLGVAICVPAGIYLCEKGIVQTQLDKLGFVFASMLAGVVCGAVIGELVHAFLKRGKAAFKKINVSCENYRIDTRKLEELSRDCNGIVRRAVRAVRDSASFPR